MARGLSSDSAKVKSRVLSCIHSFISSLMFIENLLCQSHGRWWSWGLAHGGICPSSPSPVPLCPLGHAPATQSCSLLFLLMLGLPGQLHCSPLSATSPWFRTNYLLPHQREDELLTAVLRQDGTWGPSHSPLPGSSMLPRGLPLPNSGCWATHPCPAPHRYPFAH